MANAGEFYQTMGRVQQALNNMDALSTPEAQARLGEDRVMERMRQMDKDAQDLINQAWQQSEGVPEMRNRLQELIGQGVLKKDVETTPSGATIEVIRFSDISSARLPGGKPRNQFFAIVSPQGHAYWKKTQEKTKKYTASPSSSTSPDATVRGGSTNSQQAPTTSAADILSTAWDKVTNVADALRNGVVGAFTPDYSSPSEKPWNTLGQRTKELVQRNK